MSYYMKSSEEEGNNKLYRIVSNGTTTAKGAYLPGCNVYLFPYSTDPEGKDLVETGTATGNAKLASFWLTGAEVSGGTVTGIDELISDINEQSTTFHKGVYDLQGRCVRTTNSLDGLHQAYISWVAINMLLNKRMEIIMKAIYVSPTTTIIKTEAFQLMAGSLGLSTEKNTLRYDGTETDSIGPDTGGDETLGGGENLDGAKRNWNCWDVE